MVSIRQMAIEDYELVYDLWIHTPGMGLNTADDSKEGIARYLKRNPTTCFVAESGDKVVGALLAGHDGRRGYLYHAAVLPGFQRQGIARAPSTPEASVSLSGAVHFSGSALAPSITPRMEPAVAPLQSVSKPGITAMFSVFSRSISPQSRAMATICALEIVWHQS